MTTIIVFILVLGFLIFIHELGHYLAARAVGVEVQEFSIGFPPQLYSKVIGATRYILSAIPIGGYVKLKGQNIDDEDATDPQNYASKTILQRLFILVAGSGMNFLAALIFTPLVLFIGSDVPRYFQQPAVIYSVEQGSLSQKAGLQADDRITSVNGTQVSSWEEVRKNLVKGTTDQIRIRFQREGRILRALIPLEPLKKGKPIGWNYYIEPEIGKLSAGGPAEKAGLKSGDRLVAINGESLLVWNDIPRLIKKYDGAAMDIAYSRNGTNHTIRITPVKNGSDQWIIGVGTPMMRISHSFSDSVVQGVGQVFNAVKLTFGFLGQLISGKAKSDSVGGPIMIASMVGQAAQSSLVDLLSLVGFISLQLSIFNLLPVPALDGGHVLFLLFEKIKGSALSKKFRVSSQKIGFIILISLILYISIQDGLKLLPV